MGIISGLLFVCLFNRFPPPYPPPNAPFSEDFLKRKVSLVAADMLTSNNKRLKLYTLYKELSL